MSSMNLKQYQSQWESPTLAWKAHTHRCVQNWSACCGLHTLGGHTAILDG